MCSTRKSIPLVKVPTGERNAHGIPHSDGQDLELVLGRREPSPDGCSEFLSIKDFACGLTPIQAAAICVAVGQQ